jgi:hypothetical protein
VDRVKQWWTYCFQASLSFILARKLMALKANLRVWNEKVFGNVERQKSFLWKNYEVVLKLLRKRGPYDERMRKAKTISDLERSILMEEASWMQKSKAALLREGDKCTKLFLQNDQL